MSASLTVSVILLIGFNLPGRSVRADGNTLAVFGNVKFHHKRQVTHNLCDIPSPLENGSYFPHLRRCPPDEDNSASCRLKPRTKVNAGWVIRYSCDVGYRLNTSRVASICLERPGGARWLPPLPSCVETSYSSNFLPPKNVCGKPSKHLQNKREIESKTSKRGAWPWMVIFGHNKTGDPRDGIHWFCAGTLVTTRHVLTAANCVANYRRRPVFLARLDDLHLNNSVRDGAAAIEVGIEKKIVNQGFEQRDILSDNIALIKLKTDITITDFVRPICLPSPDFQERNLVGEIVYLTSWGQTDEDRERNPKRKHRFEPILHEISAVIIDHDVCKKNYRSYQSRDTDIIINDKLICASVHVNKSCQGDVGSPLMLRHKGSYFLLGIVATADYHCFDAENFPRLFTKISMYMDWIIINLKL